MFVMIKYLEKELCFKLADDNGLIYYSYCSDELTIAYQKTGFRGKLKKGWPCLLRIVLRQHQPKRR